MNKILCGVVVIFSVLAGVAGCSGISSSPFVTEIKNSDQFNTRTNNNERVAVLFYFPACPGCKIVSPFFNNLAEEYKDKMTFCKVNIPKNRDLAKKYNVRAVPRFMFFQNGKDISGLVKISDTDEMPDLIEKYAK